jgi:serine/threonine-protein kinase
MRFAEGAMIGKDYRLGQRIASGGVAEVWAATDLSAQRTVALKRLLPRFARHRDLTTGLEREGDLLGRISSDLVVRVLRVITTPSSGPVLVMERIGGRSLSRALEDGPMSVEAARELGFHLLRALAALTRARIVHCDLKPSNVILQPLGGGRLRPVLVDFGAARVEGTPPSAAELTMGTLEYMAPEQLAGGTITTRTDQYALGTILFRAVAGENPFGELGGAELVRNKLGHEARRISTGRSDWMARRLECAIARALRRDPGQRYHNADEMMTELMALEKLAPGRAA